MKFKRGFFPTSFTGWVVLSLIFLVIVSLSYFYIRNSGGGLVASIKNSMRFGTG